MTTERDETPHGGHRIRQVEAIADGTVIDHIPAAATLKVVDLIATGTDQVFIGINLRSSRHGRKGVVKIAGRELDPGVMSRLALVAPEAAISIIRDYRVVHKSAPPVPDVFEGVARCANPNCVTNHERWSTRFAVVSREPLVVRCVYCERSFAGKELVVT